MHALLRSIAALFILLAVALAQSPDPVAADRARLLEEVKSVPRNGVPGPVVLWAPAAFPLLVAGEGESRQVVGAASRLGKGRVVIFGHTSLLGEAAEGDLPRLLLNAARWASQKEKPRVGTRAAKFPAAWGEQHFPSAPLTKLDATSLNRIDLLLVTASSFTSEQELTEVRRFVENGGGLIAAMTGWAATRSYGNQGFATPEACNGLLAGAGLGWTGETLRGNGPLTPAAEPLPMLNAWTALQALLPKPGAAPLAPEVLETGAGTIRTALGAMPPASRAPFQEGLARFLASAPPVPVPTHDQPLRLPQDAAARARTALESRLLALLPPAAVKAHPASSIFPGRVAAGAPPVTKTMTIDPAVPGWQSTGLYADAGALIRIKLPPECAGQGYRLRLGCHTDVLYSQEKWERMPELTVSVPLEAAETAAANAFGGLIYVEVPEKARQPQPFPVTIAGGVEAPLYVVGKTTDAQWQAMLKTSAPWAELACPGVILSVPLEAARLVEKPAELMTFWQAVVAAEDELAHTADKRRRPERMVADQQISAGFMHSGYPIMYHLPQAKDAMTLAAGKWPGWGFYHELGHNHQQSAWTFEGTTEVTCNLFSLYVVATVEKRPMIAGHEAVKPDSQARRRGVYLSAGAPYEKWKSDPFLALGMYLELLDGFGFEPLKQVLRTYQSDAAGPQPKTDADRRDQWMIRYARSVNKNLGPFFDKWGVPVTPAAKAEIAALPAWMPAELSP